MSQIQAETQELDEVDREALDAEAAVAAATAAESVQTEAKETGDEGTANEGGEGDEAIFQFGDEAAPTSQTSDDAAAPEWVRELRKTNRELARKNRELEAARNQPQQQQATVPVLGNKPTLNDFDYDEGKFDEALGKWYSDKAKVDAARADQERANADRQRGIDERLNGYRTEASQLKVRDFQDVESEVVGALSVEQQGILLSGADKPAMLVYALGRHPVKLRTLSQIKDPVRFAFAAAKLEKELKVTTRNATNKPAPEGRITSSSGGPTATGGDKKLEQLRAEAEKTGDSTKVLRYKAQLREAARARK